MQLRDPRRFNFLHLPLLESVLSDDTVPLWSVRLLTCECWKLMSCHKTNTSNAQPSLDNNDNHAFDSISHSSFIHS